MWFMFSQLRKKFFLGAGRQSIRRAPRYIRPRLEILENRLVLDAYAFTGIGGGTDWFNPNNWVDTTKNVIGVPGATDDATIDGPFNVIIGGQAANVNSLTLGSGNNSPTLTINSSLDLYDMTSAPDTTVTVAGGSQPAVLTVNDAATFYGTVSDPGRIVANTTNPYTGTGVVFAGAATIGPGDLNGNLSAGPNSSFTFEFPSTFAAGATFGLGSGDVYIEAPVAIMGNFYYQTMTLDLTPDGYLYGPGQIQDNSIFNWTGGTLAVAGGLYNTGEFTASGPNPLSLDTTLTNESLFMHLEGTGTLGLDPGGVIDNLSGTIFLSQPTVTNTKGGTGGITNSALGTLDVTAPATTPTVLSTPLTNEGTLNVDGGDALVLTTPTGSGGSANILLDGNLGLTGNLYLLTTASSTSGFNLSGGGGYFEVGNVPTGPPYVDGTGILIVPTGARDHIGGNLEINAGSTLTGGGTVSNDGLVQLDGSGTSNTLGLGYYVQGNAGTLALMVTGPDTSAGLSVTGTAQLSGTLKLLNYTPAVGDTFTVVSAEGGLSGHFDSIPDGMVETDGPTSASVTQVRPPV